jgi:Uma2 family endonuclease
MTTLRIITGESTRRQRWLITLQGGIESMLRHQEQSLVSGGIPWFVHPARTDSATPDVFVAYGVARGERTAYRQWEEGNVVPQVVFDAFAPGMSAVVVCRKLKFYEKAGVEEYYMYDPETGDMQGWIHNGTEFEEVANLDGWQSPRLGVSFLVEGGELVLVRADGERFLSYVELAERYERDHERAQQEHERAEQERKRADYNAAREKMLMARLRALGFNPDDVTSDNFSDSVDTSEVPSIE